MGGGGMSSINSQTKALFQLAAKIASDNYPETMGNLFIVNAPMMFSGIWRVAKGFLDERTRKKIEVKGGSYLKTLLEFAEEEDIPEFLGGKCTEPFPSDVGPWNDYEIVDNKFRKKNSEGTELIEPPIEEIKEEVKEEVNALTNTLKFDNREVAQSTTSLNSEKDYGERRETAGTIFYDCVDDENELENDVATSGKEANKKLSLLKSDREKPKRSIQG